MSEKENSRDNRLRAQIRTDGVMLGYLIVTTPWLFHPTTGALERLMWALASFTLLGILGWLQHREVFNDNER